MNAVIVYEDPAGAIKARIIFERAASRADGELRCVIKPWRLDLLGLPATADAALDEAVDAHVVMVGLRGSNLLPAFLENWLDRWAARREVREAALAFLEDGAGDAPSARMAPDLSHFAQRHGLSLVLGDTSRGQNEFLGYARSNELNEKGQL